MSPGVEVPHRAKLACGHLSLNIMPSFDESYDVVVAGYGFAGGAAAIAAADAGGSALLLEKMPDPGGISITAGGGIRISQTAEAAFDYIRASNGGRTPDIHQMPVGGVTTVGRVLVHGCNNDSVLACVVADRKRCE